MSTILTNTTTLFVISRAITLSKLIVALVAFTKYQDLVLGISGLNIDSHLIMYIAKTI